jgi:Sulfatase
VGLLCATNLPAQAEVCYSVVTERQRGREAGRVQSAARAGAHLAALCALAFAQPLFDILGKNPAFFAVRDSSSAQIVLFALALTLVPPAVLLAAEVLVSFASRTAARLLHLGFVAGLAAVIVLHVLTKSDALSGVGALVTAAVAGVTVAALYRRVPAVQSFLTVLVAAPVVFLVLFLFDSPVSKLVFPEQAKATTVAVGSKTPVVLIVFDEFPTVALMNRAEHVDAVRFPNFASLARNATWYRSATTVHPHTEHAVPAILTGKLPKQSELPIFADHRQNLFTFLGGSYRLDAVEALTHLCPPKLCNRGRKTQELDTSASDETGSLASDAGIVYLHLLLPEPYVEHVPPISNTWGNFGGSAETEQGEQPFCGRNICKLASLITADRKPTLYFVHSLLPHVPWLYLPSGKRYGGDVRVIPGAPNGYWGDDKWLAEQAEQRFFLQLGYADGALGLLMRRLRATGVYDRALVIVTADHGVSFRPGTPRRNISAGNLVDIAFMPLFVKLPGQKHGRIDDSFVQTIDVLPTIAAALHTKLPWPVDGKPLIGRKLPRDGTVRIASSTGRPVTSDLRALLARRRQALADQLAVFGSGALARVYRIGPHPELLDRSVSSLSIGASTNESVHVSGRELLNAVDPALDLVPTYVTGTLGGSHPAQQDLAIGVNGTIAAVTRSYSEAGQAKFGAMIPERSLRPGANEVSVYAVNGNALTELRGSDVTYELANEALAASDGTSIPVGRAIAGEVRGTRSSSGSTLGGWAANVKARKPAGSIIVFVDGKSVYVGDNGNITRKDILKRYGVDKAGFIFRLPGSLLPNAGTHDDVRVFAIAGNAASELKYLPGYPWKTR